jgi:hypothetical protein
MHCPGQEAFIATLHPTSALFERPVHLKRAKQAHRQFQQTLRAFGLDVLLARDVLLQVQPPARPASVSSFASCARLCRVRAACVVRCSNGCVRSQDCETDAKARRELEDFAVSHLQYVWAYNGVVSAAHAALNPTADVPHGPHGRACFIDEHYKRDVIGAPRNSRIIASNPFVSSHTRDDVLQSISQGPWTLRAWSTCCYAILPLYSRRPIGRLL